MRTISRALILALLAAATSPLVARADPEYSYVFDAPTYVVAPNETVLVSVYLQETLGAGDTSLLSTEGLFGAGVRVTFGGPVAIASESDVIANPEFDQAPPVVDLVPGDSAGLLESVDFANPAGAVFGTAFGTDSFRILLGQFRFTAGASPGETTITAIDFLPGTSADTITGTTFTVLDDLIQPGSARIQVRGLVAVPEPASLAMLACGVPILVVKLRRSRLIGVSPRT